MGLLDRVFKRELTVTGTEVSMQPQVDQFWSDLRETGFFSPRLIERIWVAARCIQLNSQQIAGMPLRFTGTFEPAWLSSPDPVWYPNGISDAIFAVTRSLYGWGDAFLYITSRYANGFPSGWTVLDPAATSVENPNGRRVYRVNGGLLNTNDVVQITRDPGGGLRGTSALRAYSAQAWAGIGAGTLTQNVMAGGTIPPVTLMAKRTLTKDQASKVQDQWVTARARYGSGVPAILSAKDFEKPEALSISPKDLVLLELQEYNARAIASAFGVPALMLNLPMSGSLVYQNPALLGEFWWRFELRPTAKRIADALTAQMLPRGNSVVFDAADTFQVLTDQSTLDDSQAAVASPSDTNVTPLRPARGGEA